MTSIEERPRVAIIPGDPSGIGPELIAKLLQREDVVDAANILLIGDRHVFEQGAEQSASPLELMKIDEDEVATQIGVSFLEHQTLAPSEVRVADVSEAGGRSSLRTLDRALDLAQTDLVDGVLFGPFNKAAMTMAGLDAEDEHVYMARYIGFEGYRSEINVLGALMTTRVTSHIPLKDVAGAIDTPSVLRAIRLAYATLRRSGETHPRIAVAALNPHAGDNGKFGREEIEILEPAIAQARNMQMNVVGPLPSDTVFLRARSGDVDAVVTMYHDQGQIAIKLMGFDRGVTIAGGLPIPVATPAHGTAFDIAGKNKADVGATLEAFRLLVRMARTRRIERTDK